MSAMYHAEALSRAAKEADDDDETIGPKIARLSRASKTLTDAIKSAKGIGGSSLVVIAALKELRDAVDEDLRRATKDNECVYMVRVPAFEDLPPLGAAAVVKAIPLPPESLDSSGETLFSKIVPESGFKALSKYTEKVDALIREENDVLALASDEARLALTEMELPELLVAAMATSASAVPPGGAGDTAAGRGAGLPSPLDAEVASIQNAGGVSGLRNNLQRLHDVHEACAQQLDAAERMLDVEAKEDDACRGAYGPGNWTRPASADLSVNLRDKIASYRGNLAQAFRSDDSLRMRVADAADGVLGLLDPVALAAATPALRAPMLSTAPDPVPALRAALEDLEAVGAERAGIEDMMRQLKEKDNIMSKVMAKTGDDYETLFALEIAKYDRAREAVASNVSSQSDILSRLRDNHASFLEQYDVPAWRAAMASHAETVRAATAHHRELSSGVERGKTFYAGFAQAVAQLGADCEGFVENRRREKRELEQAVAQRAQQAATVAEHHAAATAAAQRAAADQAAAQRAVAEAQASMHARGAAAATTVGPAPPPGVSAVADPFARERADAVSAAAVAAPTAARVFLAAIGAESAGVRRVSGTVRRASAPVSAARGAARATVSSTVRTCAGATSVSAAAAEWFASLSDDTVRGASWGGRAAAAAAELRGWVPVDARDGCDDTTVFAHRIKNRGILMNRSRLPASLPHHVRQILHVLSLLPVMM